MISDPAVLKKLAAITEIPTLPEVIQEVLEAVASEESAAGDLAAILSKDQALCSKVLKIANSAFFAQSRRIYAINDAVVVLGFDSIAQLMLATSVFSVFGGPKSYEKFDVYGFWQHSIATAIASRLIAQRVGEAPNDNVIYTAGLLHDIGKLVLITYFASEYISVLEKVESEDLFLHEAEKLLMGCTHCDISEWVCNRWNFPEELVRFIAEHHHGVCSEDCAGCGPCIVRLADVICNRLHIGNSGNTKSYELKPAEYAAIGLEDSDIAAIEEVMEKSRDEIESILKAIM